MNTTTPSSDQSSPYWQEAYRKAAEITDSVSPNREQRKAAIHSYWQAVLKAIRMDRN